MKKRKMKKIIAFIISLAIFINSVFMVFGTSISSAITYPGPPQTSTQQPESTPYAPGQQNQNNNQNDATNDNQDREENQTTKVVSSPSGDLVSGIGSLATGLVLIVLSPLKYLVLLVGYLLKALMTSVINVGTGSWNGVNEITIENILFAGYNRGNSFKAVDLADINFFDLNTENGTVNALRGAVAQWYYIMRLIAAAILLVILIYVGIRMAISTIASEQAKYKQMLVDWVTSLALLFVLHYIILFFIQLNSSLVKALGSLLKLGEDNQTIGQLLNQEIVFDIWVSFFSGMIAAIVYVMIQFRVFRFFLFYLKRMITVGFLIIIAPLITITYSIDKIGDGKAQALNAWLKELVYNILIQPFHCVLYLAFFGAIYEMVEGWSVNSLLPYILAFVILGFMDKAEEILRKIFHFEANSMPSINEPAQGFMNATGRFAKMGMGAGKAFANFRAAGGVAALKSDFQNRKAKKQVKQDFQNGQIAHPEGMSFKEYKRTEDYNTKVEEKVKTNAAQQAEEKRRKRNEKAKKAYDSKYGDGAYNREVEEKYDAAVEDEARKAYDKKFGDGAYDKVKATAQKRDENGNQTASAKKAQKILDGTIKNNYEKEAKKKVNKKQVKNDVSDRIISEETPSGRTIRSYRKFNQAYKRFTDMRSVKAASGLFKDSMKVASSIAFGAAAYGMTGQMNDAISMGQLGYGLTTGFLENTTKTVEQDSGALFTQYAINHGLTPEQMKNFAEELANQCDAENIAGLFKNLGDQFTKMEQNLEKILGQNAATLIDQIRINTANGDYYDIYQMLAEYTTDNNLDLDDSQQQKAIDQLSKASDLMVKSMIAGSFSKLESTVGMDIDSYGRESSKYIENTTINNYIDQRKNYNTTYNNTNTTP